MAGVAGPSRQQPAGKINQAADRGDGDEDEDEDKDENKDEDEDEIPSYEVLLTASVERFGVSRMQDFIEVIVFLYFSLFVVKLTIFKMYPSPSISVQ